MLFKSLLAALAPSPHRERPPSLSPASLTFSVTNDKPESVLEADQTKFRVIGTNGPVMVYAISAGPFSTEERDMMKISKAWLIDSIIEKGLVASHGSDGLLGHAMGNIAKFLGQSLPAERARALAYLVAHDTVGYGPISVILDDLGDIEEIEVNAPTSNIAVYHRRYGRCITNMRFNSEADFRYTINRMAGKSGKELSNVSGVIDAQLGRCRLHAQTKPYSINGGAASIRVGNGVILGIRELMLNRTITPGALAYLWMAVESGKNIVISGAPGSGKTTMLAALSAFMPDTCRVVTIEEEINEIRLDGGLTNVVQLQSSSPGMSVGDQVRNALHMRPEMLIVGEIRGREANEVFSGANIGVPFMTTMHSDSDGIGIVSRLRSEPMHLEERLVKRLEISLFMRRDANGSRKLESVSEYTWGDGDGPMPLKISRIVASSSVDMEGIHCSRVVAEFGAAKSRAGAPLKEFKQREAYLGKLPSDAVATDMAMRVREY